MNSTTNRQAIRISTGVMALLLAGCYAIFTFIDGCFLSKNPAAAEREKQRPPVIIMIQRIAERTLTPAATTTGPYSGEPRGGNEPTFVSAEDKLYASLTSVEKNNRQLGGADMAKSELPKP